MAERSFRALIENDKEGRRMFWDESGDGEIAVHTLSG